VSADLGTTYLGFDLASPLVASPSPMTGDLALVKHIVAAGAGAVVLPSLFEEQLEHEAEQLFHLGTLGADTNPEADGYFPDLDGYNAGPDEYLRLVADATRAVDVPVIASLNGHTSGGWVHYAERIADAGADALELNLYLVPTSPRESGAEVEARTLRLVRAVRDAVDIPLAVKLAPMYTAPLHFVMQVLQAGANGVTLFNRLLAPDLDLEQLALTPRLSLSRHEELRVPLQWIGLLREHTKASIAASSGIHSGLDALKLIAVGADVAMTTTAILRGGPAHFSAMLAELRKWLEEREYESVRQLRGSMSHAHCPDPSGYERVNYMRTLVSWGSELV
jgi:dihydroorotate dehydrogenase (fumarate)